MNKKVIAVAAALGIALVSYLTGVDLSDIQKLLNPGTEQASVAPSGMTTVEVERVVDGDTIVVKWEGKSERVRFIGVDTPETVHPEKGEQPFGKVSSDYTKSRLLAGQNIQLEFDVQQRDQYGRLLAYIWLDGEHFNATLLKEGYATLSTWPPNVKYVEQYTELQKQAREKEAGLWGEKDIASQYKVGRYAVNPQDGLPAEKINVNTATREELMLLPGVKDSLSEAIIAQRSKKKFQKPEDLGQVPGIGSATLSKLLPYVAVK